MYILLEFISNEKNLKIKTLLIDGSIGEISPTYFHKKEQELL